MRKRSIYLCLCLSLAAVQSCATNHLLRWSGGEPSVYAEPTAEHAAYSVPAGTMVAFPVALAWDVATFPFQWLWGVHPFGSTLGPEDIASTAR